MNAPISILPKRLWLISLLILAIFGSSVAARAEKPAFGGDFKFRKLTPPIKGEKKRITIQIDPDFVPFPKAPDKPKPAIEAGATPVVKGKTDWFWNAVAPGIDAGSPGRFIQATEFLDQSDQTPTLGVPRLATLQRIVDDHGRLVMRETLGTKVSPAFVLALIAVESAGRVTAESNKGAQGLMQLIPDTAARFGVKDSNDPGQNIAGGVKYLDWLLGEFGGDPLLALAGYNAGENAVRKYSGVPPFAETRAYVPKVLATWSLARGLCLTQPILASDGCVFRLSP